MNPNPIQLTTATTTDIQGVLALQQKYLVTNLTETQKSGGFVTTPFTTEQLQEIIDKKGLFLAKHDHKIIAYCFAASWQYFAQWPIFAHMIQQFPNWQFQNAPITEHNTFQYGPICIDIPFRGQGIINKLVEFMRQNMVASYPIAVTFINKTNIPSFKAHTQKLPWTVINTFTFNNNNYHVLALDLSIKVP